MNTSGTPSTRSTDNPIWRFLSSVRLAVFLLIALAVTSIVGTLIPQGEAPQVYLDKYGPTTFEVFRVLHLYDMYHSWWYLGLLGLFSQNLIVCTLRRLPFTLERFRRDGLDLDAPRLEKMPLRRRWEVKGNGAQGAREEILTALTRETGGRVRERSDVDGGTLVLAEHGRWSFWGLYGLHGSVLIIFAGAIVGSLLGFKGSLTLMEGQTAESAVETETGQAVPLGFSIRCDRFNVSFYDTGAPKEFRSDLVVLNDGHEVLKKSVRVNDPLTYKGITFYQANYQAAPPEITLRVLTADGRQSTLGASAFKWVALEDTGAALGVMQYLPNVHGSQAALVRWSDKAGPPVDVWVRKGYDREVKRGNGVYMLSLVDVKERYITGLQVKRDPGVWIVWLGCTGLILGFVVVFWVSHRRVWLWIGPHEGRTVIRLAGQADKNRMGFEKAFSRIATVLDRRLGGQP